MFDEARLDHLQDWGGCLAEFLREYGFVHIVPTSKVPVMIRESYAINRQGSIM